VADTLEEPHKLELPPSRSRALPVAAWLVVELLVPGIFFLAYLLVRGALARVANDRHDCEGNLVRSVGWGVGWATAYVAPLALVVWLVHTYVKLR